MSSNQETPQIPLPIGWKQHVRSSVLQVISLAQYATVYTRSWATDSVNCRVRLKAELDRANQEHALLQEELRIKDARMMRIDPQRRPHYPPVERMAILQLRAARGWSLEQGCWWVLIVVDHFSRRTMRFGVFATRPNCRAVCTNLGQTVRRVGSAPKYIVCDRDSVFDCDAFRRWVKRKGIRPPRYGAVGKHGSIAVVERFILTLKQLLQQIPLIPLRRELFRCELLAIAQWYNEHRPHVTFGGKTPNEVYERRFPANRKPRLEPRLGWPRGSPCAKPWALVGGKPGQQFGMTVSFHKKRRHLPVMMLKRAA